MKITYISHTGFLVETDTVSLLFDYWNGEVPAFSQEKPLYIFSSHRHEDHFNPEIFTLPGRPEDTRYLLGYDILRQKNFYRKCPQAIPYRDAERVYSLRMKESYAIGDLEVWPLKSTDEGVGFLVGIPAEKRLIYHAGDLNWWLWDGEPEEQNKYYTGSFKKEVSNLAELVKEHCYRSVMATGNAPEELPAIEQASASDNMSPAIPTLDLGFFTMDPRQEMYEFNGFDYYLQNIPVRCAFPMHCWDQYDVIDRYLEMRSGVVKELLPITGGERGQCSVMSEESLDIYIPHIRKRGEEYEI